MRIDPRRCFAPGPRTLVAAAVVLIATGGFALGGAKHGAENVHREATGAGCVSCHAVDESALRAGASAASPMLPDDLDARCAACHDPLDASHKTGVLPKKQIPGALPLSADGKVTCATCHFMHAENDTFGDFVRLDNRQGALCLSCHELTDLQ